MVWTRKLISGYFLLLSQLEVLGALDAQLLLGLALLAFQTKSNLLGGLSLNNCKHKINM